MMRDPSRRPSNQRVRIAGDINAMVWVECSSCLGDGWHYPMATAIVDRARKSRKITCVACSGLGARQFARLQCGPGARIVAPPKGHIFEEGDV